MTRAAPLAVAALLWPGWAAGAFLPELSDKEYAALAAELSVPEPSSPPSPALSEAERATLEKSLSSDAAVVRVGPGVTRAKAAGLKRFLAEVDVRTAPVHKIALAFDDCEAVDGRAAAGVPYFVKRFDAEVGYAGDWLYLPGTAGGAERTFKALRWLHAASLRTMRDGGKPRGKGLTSWERELIDLARLMPLLRVYDVYHYSRKRKGLVHDGLSTFLPRGAEPAGGGTESVGDGIGIRRGRPVPSPGGGRDGLSAKRPPPSEDPEDLCYADYDVDEACARADPDATDAECLVELSERINCLCHKVCEAGPARRARQ